MLKWAAIFVVIAIVAAVFGFGGIAAGAPCRDREGSVFHISSRFRDYFDHGDDAKVVQTAIDACSVLSLRRHDEYRMQSTLILSNVRLVASALSRHRSEQGPDACRQPHGKCAPERDAHCAHRHTCAAHARSQPAQDREEHQRSSGDDGDQTRLRDCGNSQQRHGCANGEAGR